jgi:hypothetical protein
LRSARNRGQATSIIQRWQHHAGTLLSVRQLGATDFSAAQFSFIARRDMRIGMSLLPPDPPSASRHDVKLETEKGLWDGPTHSYRGATIHCMKGSHVCGFVLDGHPLSRRGSFGVVGTITPLIDLWLDHHRLPAYMRVVGK